VRGVGVRPIAGLREESGKVRQNPQPRATKKRQISAVTMSRRTFPGLPSESLRTPVDVSYPVKQLSGPSTIVLRHTARMLDKSIAEDVRRLSWPI
jgi:hypothetical protein